ncbi:AMP-dependent synthetase/ligase [Actinomarinicola tropica]|uniref:AMP-binding protein n=1 Tax=Actinomarinicola tropica TaxID=2789776 RepID=A0A5Q2RL36_9ACTN|nr:long-chain fatty acid--CoA ligase [Actinomarinicola tropica]QGG94570.1 AMP-binding protein [Actinomarinicola tropica]
MREISGPPMAPIAEESHLLEPLLRWAAEDPQRPLLSHREQDAFVATSAADVLVEVRGVAAGLVACGVSPGDRVAIMSRSRPEWIVLDMAILAAGAATVPVYETSSPDQVAWILSDSGAVLTVVETAAMASLVNGALVIDDGALEELRARGADVDPAEIDRRIGALGRDDVASIVYTSGTTGMPKGCVLTHGNLRVNTLQSLDAARSMLTDDETILIFLPLAHVLTKTVALLSLEWGATLAFATDLAHLAEELPLAQPTIIVSVPRVFEKVHASAQRKAAASHKGKLFEAAELVAAGWSRAHEAGRRRPDLDLGHLAFDHLLYGKISDVFGGRLRVAFSGGSALGERLTRFFHGAGIHIFEGYGLTETSPTLTINTEAHWRPGTVGRPVAGTTIRIADDGEILATGPQVFKGYWRNAEATAEVIDADGWFHTGDLGELEDGYLRITGRKKELIVTAAGKNVAPAPLEDRLRAHPLVSQAIVVGDRRAYVAAMLTVDEEAVHEWASTRGLDVIDLRDPDVDAALRAELQRAVDHANDAVSRAEAIKRFAVLPHDLTVESGELTPTLKVRREVVAAAYGSVIEDLYA